MTPSDPERWNAKSPIFLARTVGATSIKVSMLIHVEEGRDIRDPASEEPPVLPIFWDPYLC